MYQLFVRMACSLMQVSATQIVTQDMKVLDQYVGVNAHLILKNVELFAYLQEVALNMFWES